MTDPQYLSDEGSEATDLERELLLAAQGVRLENKEREAIWASVSAQVAALNAGAAGAAVGAPGAAAKAVWVLTPTVKAMLVVGALAGFSAVGYGLSRTPAAPTERAAPFAPAPTAARPNPTTDAVARMPELPVTQAAPSASTAVSPDAMPRSVVSAHDSAAQEKSALRDESAAVLEIRRTLRGGDASSALRMLEQARQRFPRGALSQEREALTIEALAKSGAKAAAARRAQSFLHTYPKSPYVSDVQSFAAP